MRKILLLSACILLFSCENEIPQNNQPERSLNQRKKEDAIQIASAVFANLSKTTRTSYLIDSLTVEPLLSNSRNTRANTETTIDTPYFIVNKGDNSGFVLVNGDKRTTPILAFSETGHLETKDFENNPGLKMFKERCDEALPSKILGVRVPTEDEKGQPIPDPNIYYTPLETHILMRNIVWGQGTPYNDLALDEYGNKCPTGCVATAISQLLAYYKHPRTIGGRTFDWDKLLYQGTKNSDDVSYIKREVAMLFHKVGETIGMKYTPQISYPSSTYPPTLFSNLDFNLESYDREANIDVTKSMLAEIKKGKPAIMVGYNNPKSGSGRIIGHMWIADGWGRFRKVTTYPDKPNTQYWDTQSEKDIYIHMNWGWSGKHNGFFFANVYNIQDPRAQLSRDPYYRRQEAYNFSQDFSYWIFVPNRTNR